MNGISLAALLGAATWLGSKILAADEAEENAVAHDKAPVPAASSEAIETHEKEFLWPSGPMFQ